MIYSVRILLEILSNSLALFSVSDLDLPPIKAGIHTFSSAVNSGNN